jgi:hypothetical protein
MLGMGVVAGYLGAAPSLVWAASVLAVVLAPLLIVVSVWLYTLVFAFSALWFAHYALAALQALRAPRDTAAAFPGDVPSTATVAVPTATPSIAAPAAPTMPNDSTGTP